MAALRGVTSRHAESSMIGSTKTIALALSVAMKSGLHMTRRWRRQSRANPSLKPKFPASRENTGNFIDSGLGRASTVEKTSIVSILYGPIPYASEQGIFYGLAGNLNRRSGKFPPRSGNSALVRYFRAANVSGGFFPYRQRSRSLGGSELVGQKTHGPRHPTDLARRPARAVRTARMRASGQFGLTPLTDNREAIG